MTNRKRTRSIFLQRALSATVALSIVACLSCSGQPPCNLDSLAIISRAGWNAQEPNLNSVNEHGGYDSIKNPEGWRVYDRPLSQVLNTIVVHHSALPLSDGPREIQQMHLQFKGYADIGYHFLIDQNGKMYHGRELTARGAHTGGFNTGTVGIVLLGNFEETPPPDAQLTSFKTLAQCLVSAYGITHLAGHRDFQPTETVCPGKFLEPRLPALAQELNLKFGTDGYVPPHP